MDNKIRKSRMSLPISWRGIRGGADNIGILCVMMGSGFFLKGDVAAARPMLPPPGPLEKKPQLPVAARRPLEKKPQPLEKKPQLPQFLSTSKTISERLEISGKYKIVQKTSLFQSSMLWTYRYYKVIQITFNANDARAQLCVPCVTLCELCGEIV